MMDTTESLPTLAPVAGSVPITDPTVALGSKSSMIVSDTLSSAAVSVAVAVATSWPATAGTAMSAPGPALKNQPVPPASAASSTTRAKSQKPRALRFPDFSARADVLSATTGPVRWRTRGVMIWVASFEASRPGSDGITMVRCTEVAAVGTPVESWAWVSSSCSSIVLASCGRWSGSRAVAQSTSSSSSAGTSGFFELGVPTVSLACWCAIWKGCSPLKGCSPASIS